MTLKSININGRLIDFSTPKVMGILNVTPDSFFEKSRYLKGNKAIVDKAGGMIEQGASFIDIGGYSTRPHAINISVAEELDRVLPVIEIISKNFPEIAISIDTFRSEVARKSIEVGANIINDISGGNLDEKMFQTVADLSVPYILMHSRGNPETMNQLNDYQAGGVPQLTLVIITELQQKIYQLRELGVKDIIIDPGFGFAKNAKQGFEMMRNLTAFQIMELPFLVGVSRKSMIWRTLNITANEALNGTTALNMFALMQGANILRVHDVKEAMETVKLYQELAF